MFQVATTPSGRSFKRVPTWSWSLLGLIAWAFLLKLQGPSFAAGDSGETVTAAFLLGIPHPPGHPLSVLLGKLSLWVPVGTAAFRINLLSSLIVILAATVLGTWCREYLSRLNPRYDGSISAWAGGIAFAALLCSPMVLENALSAKGSVYILTLLWMVLILQSVHWEEPARARNVFQLFFFLGLAFATHWPSALLGGVYGLVWMFDGRYKNSKLWAYGALAFGFGLSVYLYLPIRSAQFPALDWGHPVTWDSFVWVVSRSAYSEWSQRSGAWLSGVQTLWGLGNVVLVSFPGAFLGLLGLWGWRGRSARSGWGYGLAILVPVAGIAIFPRLLPESLFLVSNYWAPFQGFWVFLSVMGLWTIGTYVAHERKTWVWVVLFALAASAVLWWPKVSSLDQSRHFMSRDLGVNLLQGLPKGAVILTEGDTPTVSVLHARWVEKMRPDIYAIPAIFVGERWGFEKALKDLNLSVGNFPMPQTPKERLNWIERSASQEELGLKRSVFSNLQGGLTNRSVAGTELSFEPTGMVFRLTRAKSNPDLIRQSIWDALRHQNLRGVSKFSEDTQAKDFYVFYANPFLLSGNAMQQEARWTEACDDYAKALTVYPKSVEAYSDLAAVVAPLGMPELGEVLCLKAVGINPRYAPAWHNLGNVYSFLGKWDLALGAYERVLALNPDSSSTRQNEAIAMRMKLQNAPAQAATHDAAWYEALAVRLKAEGRELLAKEAGEVAVSKRSQGK
jgi:tetratricopeptide (TPR) repeat protein